MKKIFVCLLALLMLLPCLAGCKFMTLSDKEARAELEALLPDAKTLTEIIYGQGLPYEPIEEGSTDYYAFVTKDAPFRTVAEIQRLAETVFSKSYRETIYEYAFSGNEYYSARYFMAKIEGKYHLKINTKLEPMAMLAEIKTETAKVVEGTPAKAVVKVTVVTAAGMERQKKITLVKEDGKWLLDGAAY